MEGYNIKKPFKEKAKEKYYEWRYLGLSKDTMDSFADRVAQDNLSILCVSTIWFSILSIFSALFIQMVDYNLVKFIGLLIGGAFGFCLNVYARRVRDNGVGNLTSTVNVLITCFQIIIVFISIIVGVSDSRWPGVLIIATILFVQVVFNLSPVRNMIIIILAVVSFLTVSYMVKEPVVFSYDAEAAISVGILGYIIAWKKSKDKYEHEEALELFERNNSKLYTSSTTDPLTGLVNRRHSFDKLEVFVAQTSISKRTLACLIMDIDFFKSINDSYGHPEGDELLRNFGVMLKEVGKKYDIEFARIGGEEFMGFWKPTVNNPVEIVSSEIRRRVHELPFPEKGKHATISIGVYNDVPTNIENGDKIYSKADRAVYIAKQNGRDRVEFYDSSFDE